MRVNARNRRTAPAPWAERTAERAYTTDYEKTLYAIKTPWGAGGVPQIRRTHTNYFREIIFDCVRNLLFFLIESVNTFINYPTDKLSYITNFASGSREDFRLLKITLT